MPAVEWRRAATADLITIVEYIAADNPEAAQELKADIEIHVTRLAQQPKLYKLGRVRGTREMVVRKNYFVVYSENRRAVTVLRVLHAARQWP